MSSASTKLSKDECAEQQSNELEALQSMYMDDFCVLPAVSDSQAGSILPSTGSAPNVAVRRSDASNQPLKHFSLKLVPHPAHASASSSDIRNHVSVSMEVTLPLLYPSEPPVLRLEKLHGLSDLQLSELGSALQKQSSRLLGSVMIFELAQIAEEYLRQHNVKQVSFHEEMLARARKEEAAAQELEAKALQQEEAELRLARVSCICVILSEPHNHVHATYILCRRLHGIRIHSSNDSKRKRSGARIPTRVDRLAPHTTLVAVTVIARPHLPHPRRLDCRPLRHRLETRHTCPCQLPRHALV